MNATTKTRTQRRLEKRQTLLLLILVLAVSLASFTLGVVVGRRGAERDMASKQLAAEKILVTKVPAPVVDNAPEVAQQQPSGAAATDEDQAADQPKLTFYDNLAKEEATPLGSGINLPQEEQSPQPPIPLPEQPIVKKQVEVPAAPAVAENKAPAPTLQVAKVESGPVEKLPQVDRAGKYSVQVGSFANAGDAGNFKRKLVDKGFPAFVAEADLGAKGIWYRVRIGPYAAAETAQKVQGLLEQKEQIKGFVSRQ